MTVVLRCRACGHETTPLGVQYCDRCFGPLDLVGQPPSYAHGPTPLVAAPDLGAALGLDDLWLKDETTNPTGSFKDRVVAPCVVRAREVGMGVLACSSTGNLARAVTAGATGAGLGAALVVPEALPDGDRDALAAHGATVVVVEGDYDAANRVAAQASEELGHWGWVNANLRPWYGAGAAGLAAELLAQGPPPQQVVLPMASGSLALQIARHLAAAGHPTRFVVGQPAGCAPVAAAFAEGVDDVRPVRADTRVEVLAMGDPPEGPEVLAAARAEGGAVLAVAESDLDDVVALVAATSEVSVDLASAVGVAAARQAVTAGVLDPTARTVIVLTGGPPRWPDGPVGPPGRTVSIGPSLADLRAAVEQEP